jgi:hypothetical protein
MHYCHAEDPFGKTEAKFLSVPRRLELLPNLRRLSGVKPFVVSLSSQMKLSDIE